MHKNAHKVKRKTQTKISCQSTLDCSKVKIARLNDAFLEASRPSGSITVLKKKRKGEKGKTKKKFQNSKSLKT